MSDLFGGLVIISAGTLYPAYSSYKAVKTKNTREYVKWMMYWIVFAFFNAITIFTDIFISWFPGYYLFKTLFIIWLVSPATRGSTYLYKKILHPTLRQNEEKIDKTIANIKERGYDYTSQWARLAMQNFSKALMEAVFKGQVLIADQMQRQYMQQNNPAAVTGGRAPAPAGHTVTDGREVENMSRSSADMGRLYRVDSQMFDMDDEFIELSADMTEETQLSGARQRRKVRRPVSMPPTMMEEQHALDDGAVSDPDYTPSYEDDVQLKAKKLPRRHSAAAGAESRAKSTGRKQRRSAPQDEEVGATKRVTRSSAARKPEPDTPSPLTDDFDPESPME